MTSTTNVGEQMAGDDGGVYHILYSFSGNVYHHLCPERADCEGRCSGNASRQVSSALIDTADGHSGD